MIKKNPYFIVFALIGLIWTAGCSRPATEREEGGQQQTASAQPEERPERGNLGRPGRGRFARTSPGHGRGFHRGRDGESPDIIAFSEDEKKALGIRTARVSRRALRSQLKAMGKVLSPQQKRAIVSYAFPARIAGIHVSIGDWVKAGDKLVTLQSEEVGNARADYFKAKADYELAKRNLEREKNLHERGVGARKDMLTKEAEFKVAEAGLDAVEKKLHVLGFTEEQVNEMGKAHQINPTISLHAPIAGKIIAFNAVRGAMVDQSTEILSIMDPSLVWVDAEIFERDIARIKLTQEVKVSVPAYPSDYFQGKVSFIGDVLNEESRTITVRTEVPNRDGKLKPGMFADMTIYLTHRGEVLAVPEEGVLDDNGEKIAFIPADGGYRMQAVQVGMKDAGFYEITGGLEEGQEVVTAGNYQIKSKLYDEILKSAGVH